MTRLGAALSHNRLLLSAIAAACRPPSALRVRALGLDFPSPVGVAAGFDKNGALVAVLDALGFGFVEVGTVTPRPWGGNPRPRIFRLPADQAVINRMGLPNAGAPLVARRLEALRLRRGGAGSPSASPLGVNVGRVADGPDRDPIADYVAAVRAVRGVADYITLNVSCPNTDDGRAFDADPAAFDALLEAVAEELADSRPWLVKLSPDLDEAALTRMVDIALGRGASGFVVSNTTRAREGLTTPADRVEAVGAGGLSGRPLASRSLEALRRVRARCGPGPVIVGVGGIFTAADVRARLVAGATLVQVYTGLVYEGPLLARALNRDLAQG